MQQIFSFGFNYRVVDLQERGEVFMTPEQQLNLLKNSKTCGFETYCIMHTCNRTEVYGMGCMHTAEQLFFDHINIRPELKSKIFRKQGIEAVEHLFKVASGLDSQLVGDLEIVGQFKEAFKTAKNNQTLSGYMERLVNTCLQAAKEVRNSTKLSSGTTSLSYATIQLLLTETLTEQTNILVVGAGKFGESIARNIKEYLPQTTLTITNRTATKALTLAKQIAVHTIPFEQLAQKLSDYDVIVTALDAQPNLINPAIFPKSDTRKVLIDLCVPAAIDSRLAHQENIRLYTLDHAADIVNGAIQERLSSIPIAEEILLRHIHEFTEWNKIYAQSDSIKSWKAMTENIVNCCPYISKMPPDARDAFLKNSMSSFVLFVKRNQSAKINPQKLFTEYVECFRKGQCLPTCEHRHDTLTSCAVCPKKSKLEPVKAN